MQERLEVVHQALITLDKCHKERQNFIFVNGPGVLSNPKDALENIDPDDFPNHLKPKKSFFH